MIYLTISVLILYVVVTFDLLKHVSCCRNLRKLLDEQAIEQHIFIDKYLKKRIEKIEKKIDKTIERNRENNTNNSCRTYHIYEEKTNARFKKIDKRLEQIEKTLGLKKKNVVKK